MLFKNKILINKVLILVLILILILTLILFSNSIFFKTITGQFKWNRSETAKDKITEELFIKDFKYCIKIYGEGRMRNLYKNSDLISMSYGWKIPIEEVIIEEGVQNLTSGAFMGCNQLSSITLPNSIKIIGASSFAYCNKLNTIVYCGTIDEWNKVVENSINWNFESSINKIICNNGIINN